MNLMENLISTIAIVIVLVILCYPNYPNETTENVENYLKLEERKIQNLVLAKLQFMKLKADRMEKTIQNSISEIDDAENDAEVPLLHKFLFL